MVRDLINLIFGLTGSKKVRRMPLSGGAPGLKGDLINLPKPLDKFVPELKNQKTISIPAWWRQACEEAEEMAKEPWLIIKMGEEVLSVKRLKGELKDQYSLFLKNT